MQAKLKLDKKHLIHSLIAIVIVGCILIVMIGTPQQKQLSYRLGGSINEPVEAKVFQLRGLTNILAHHKYRVDYFDADHKKLSSKYFATKSDIPQSDWGQSVKANWRFN